MELDAEVITPEEAAKFLAYCQKKEAEQVRETYRAWLADVAGEIQRLVAFLEKCNLNTAPTYAQVGDLYAVYEKLSDVCGSLGLYEDAGV